MEETTLVGRDAELAVIHERVERAREGSAGIVVVRGPAGIGKTTLVRAAVRSASGFRLASASGEESERELAFGVADQLAGALGAGPAAAPSPTPLSVGASLLRAMSDAQTSGEPLLVWVDDVQWADLASQQALVFSLRRLDADSVCALLCVRREDEHSLLPGLGRLRAHLRTSVVDLEGLDERGIVELARQVGNPLPVAAAARLHRHTDGNPLWSAALLRELRAEHLRDPLRELPAPRPYAEIVRTRLGRLTPAARALVEVSAVAATEWPLASLATVAGVADPYAALREAVDADLLRGVGDRPALVRPVHALVSAAVVTGLGPDRRAHLHRDLAALATTEHEQLHHLVAASPGRDDDLAVRVAAQGRQHVLEGAWVTAASVLGTAARLSSDLGVRAGLTEEAMALALLAGDAGQATVLADDLTGLPDRPRALALRGWLAFARGRPREAERLLELALRGAGPDVEAEARAILAQLLVFGGRSAEAVEHARRAIRLAPPGTPIVTHVKGLLGAAMAAAGDIRGALAELGEVDPTDDDPSHFPLLVGRATTMVLAADYARAVPELERVAASTDRLAMLQYSCVLHTQACRAHFVLGDWVSAIDHGQRAVWAAEGAELSWGIAPAYATVAQVHARMGSWELATQHCRAALSAAATVRDGASVSYAHTADVVLAYCRGTPSDVVVAARPLLAMTDRDGTDTPGLLDWDVLLCESLVALGRRSEAADRVAALQRVVDGMDQPFPSAEIARLRGLLAAAAGDVDAALAWLRTAGEAAHGVPAPFERALVDLETGRILAGQGLVPEATAKITAAMDTFSRLGAEPFVERAAALLTRAGAAPRADPSARRPALTPQEVAVSRLVRQGMSNREIAAELFLSTKTVEFHLRHVFMKLGVASRTQLVARSPELLDLRAAQDLVDPPLGPAHDP